MDFIEVLLIGIALAMDAFALTIANCTTYAKSLTRKKELAMPITFAIFQFVMPAIGFFLGSLFSSWLSKISGYLTAGIFFALAIKILIDIIKEHREKENKDANKTTNFSFITLFIQGVATSIDALLIGITFLNYSVGNMFLACAIIGITTFIIVMIALFIGKGLGKVLGKYATYIGAIILFALAIKNLVMAIC